MDCAFYETMLQKYNILKNYNTNSVTYVSVVQLYYSQCLSIIKNALTCAETSSNIYPDQGHSPKMAQSEEVPNVIYWIFEEQYFWRW